MSVSLSRLAIERWFVGFAGAFMGGLLVRSVGYWTVLVSGILMLGFYFTLDRIQASEWQRRYGRGR